MLYDNKLVIVICDVSRNGTFRTDGLIIADIINHDESGTRAGR